MGSSSPQTSTVTQSIPEEAKPFLYGDGTNAGILERARALSETPLNLPSYQVAGFSQPQINAFNLAQSGIGGYMPALTQGSGAIRQGIGAAAQGVGLVPQALSSANPYYDAAGRGTQAAVSASQAGLQGAAGRSQAALAGSQPLISEGTETTRQALGTARPFMGASAGLATLSTGQYDPARSYQDFMSPFTQDVIQQVEADIGRQGKIQEQQLRSQAVGAGAFGGSRGAVAERELGRNVAEQQARSASELRARGFEQAQQQAQQAFEQQQQRGISASQILGGLGTSYGQLGLQGAGQLIGAGATAGQLGLQSAGQLADIYTNLGQIGLQGAGQMADIGTARGQLGLQGAGQLGALSQGLGSLGTQMANVGALGQQMNLADVNALMNIGTAQQAQQQAVLDAQRQNQYQQTMSPYQQLGFFSDVFQGMPVGGYGTTQTTSPGPNALSQIAGTAYGLYSLGRR